MINIWTNSLKSKHTDSTGSINIFLLVQFMGKSRKNQYLQYLSFDLGQLLLFITKFVKKFLSNEIALFFTDFLIFTFMCQSKINIQSVSFETWKKKIIPTKWQIQGGYANFTILRIIFPFSEIQTLNKLRPLGEN